MWGKRKACDHRGQPFTAARCSQCGRKMTGTEILRQLIAEYDPSLVHRLNAFLRQAYGAGGGE